ncbi:hypothetical protein M9H77_09440 [Catharanthus roseus]|uniref:Uncharacterized protein n=1 Tax=Catharanthus roseus TaxID=4058 RepID=A0ACC0C0R7_CATRO|nr:hypothetical protein M9H77_09440 [Catharanthus roseus]
MSRHTSRELPTQNSGQIKVHLLAVAALVTVENRQNQGRDHSFNRRVLGNAPSPVGWAVHATTNRDDVHSLTTGITDIPTLSSYSTAPMEFQGLVAQILARLDRFSCNDDITPPNDAPLAVQDLQRSDRSRQPPMK